MDEKINLGEVSLQEYNIIMKQLSAGQLGECIELFMRFRALGMAYEQMKNQPAPQEAPTQTLPPPVA